MSQPKPEPYPFAPAERPLFPGSPYSPAHPLHRRIGYMAVALICGIASSLGNGLVTVNLPNLAGTMGLYVYEASWLPAIYVAFNACANLLLIKARAQFGIPAVTYTLLILLAGSAALQLLLPGFEMAVVERAIAGMAAAGLSTITIYNLLQTVPPPKRPLALVAGISLGQFGPVLARMFPVELLELSGWRGLHLIEIALALAALAALLSVPLPPSDRSRAFERLDFLTIGLFMPAMLLLCGALSEGRLLWWNDTPWLGWALAAALPLFVAAFLLEFYRARPLIQVRWIGARDIFRFLVVASLVRVALAEQTYGAVGLLTNSGLNNDQLRLLFAGVFVAMVVGLATALLTVREDRIRYLVLSAALAIALSAWLDSFSNNLTRPAQLYVSQALLGFGTMLFIGPGLAFGFLQMLRKGPDHLITLIVLFSTTQNVGGLAGSALLGTYQVMSARHHALTLAERALPSDPAVAARLQAGGSLAQALGREAQFLAFNDVFRLVAALSLLTALYLVYIIVWNALRRRRELMGAAA
jgi:MFS family permease